MPATNQELLDEAVIMPDSEAKIALLERVINASDHSQDEDIGLEARIELLDVVVFYGHSEKMFAAFAWLLNYLDKDKNGWDQYASYRIMWRYKWILNNGINFPHISLERLTSLHNDFAKRYKELGYSERTVHYFLLKLALHRGLYDEAREHYAAWKQQPRDRMSDCLACETNQIVIYHLRLGDLEAALEAAKSILKGKQRCAGVPHETYAELVIPLFAHGREGQAQKYHQKGMEITKSNQEHLSIFSSHMHYLALSQQLPEALNIFEKCLSWALKTAELADYYDFSLASHAIFKRSTGKTLALRLVPDFELYQATGNYDADTLASYFLASARNIAKSFDERNQGGNNYQKKIAYYENLLMELV